MNHKTLALFVTFIFCASFAAVGQKKQIKTALIKTAIYCDHCEACETCGGIILEDLYNVRGIKTSEVRAKENVIKVVYNDRKISLDQIRQKISKLGYAADNVPADPAALKKLDDCCRKAQDGN